MRRIWHFHIFFIFLFFTGMAAAESFSIEEQDFRLLDAEGRSFDLSSSRSQKFVLLMAWPGNCANSSALLKSWARFEKQIISRPDIEVLWLNAFLPQGPTATRATAAASGVQARVLADFSQTVSQSLRLKRAGDFVLLSQNPWQVIRRGSWRDGSLREELADKLGDPGLKAKDEVLSNGCRIPYAHSKKIVWNKSLATKFYRTCVSCHTINPNIDIFKSDADIFKWSAMNRQVMRMQRMPPKSFDSDPSVSNCTGGLGYRLRQADLREIQNWLESGASHGKSNWTSELRAEMKERAASFYASMGAADLDWSMKEPDKVAAQGSFYYRYFQIAGPIEKDLEVAGYQVDTNRDVVHHLHMFVAPYPLTNDAFSTSDPTTMVRRPVRKFFIGALNLVLGYSQFKRAGWVVPKGSYVFLEVHYQPNGKETSNQTKIRIFLNKRNEKLKPVRGLDMVMPYFIIPPRESDFRMSTTWTMDKDASLLTVTYHSHRRGKTFELTMRKPGEEERPLCRITNMEKDGHSGSGHFIESVTVPKGTQFRATYTYDNSSRNPENPDPDKVVKHGFGGEDEMAFTNLWYVDGDFQREESCWDEPLGCPRR